ncbi:MAG TPA: succinyl-CoA synthetase subunit beta [Firmicutes bacterium]|jgi:succinyl-CoA synthetase beta subunit|nr:succinyl-CoA synthetase subunit beta [Bacillota bacterium]
MKLLEYQGKKLFAANGIPIPQGKVVTNALEAVEAAEQLGGDIVLKVQVPAEGRGKAGGIKFVDNSFHVHSEAGRLFKMNMEEFSIEKLLVEERLDIVEEIYMGLVVDINTGEIIFLFSPEGGVNIEQIVAGRPEKVYRLPVDPLSLPPVYQLRRFIRRGGFHGKVLEGLTGIAEKLLHLFFAYDLLMAEINPLVILPDNQIVALDAKVEVDDNALSRQKFEKKFWEERDQLEKEARGIGVTYIKLDGSIGVVGSGAGLAMATMDMLEDRGFPPANFLETGGGITEELMYNTLRLVCKNGNVTGVVINIYGGVNPIEKGAKGIVRFIRERGTPPIVVKALGNKQEECWETLREGGITVINSVKTEDAVESLLELIDARKVQAKTSGKGMM